MNKKRLIALIGATVAGTIGIIGLTIFNKGERLGEQALYGVSGIESFNSQFEKYQGDAITGTTVRGLMNAVISNNAAQTNRGGDQFIQLIGVQSVKDIKTNEIYEVIMEDKGQATMTEDGEVIVSGSADGYIDTIKITEKKDK